MHNLLQESKSENTNKKYRQYFRHFEEFCEARNLKSIPATTLNVALFLTKLISDEKSKNVVLPTVYSIKYFHELKGYDFNVSAPYIKNLMEVAKRRSAPTNKKDPIGLDDLKKICEKYHYSDELADQRDLAMMVLAFAGFLRFDDLANLRTKNIFFRGDHIEIKLEKAKTDQYREGNLVSISKGETILCPLLRLETYLKLGNIDLNEDKFLFRPLYKSKNGVKLINLDKKISYTRARECIRKKVNSVEGVNLKIGLHSFRSGGATAAVEAGVTHEEVKRHGRWKSDSSKDRYLKTSIKRRLEVTKKMAL